ncbi:MAG TPA: hypothetical protein VK399_12700 [Longimicrobiaceae bacterium]|nr:hypothetical protein [Longimicrobiaceae bacterium]
MKHGVMATATSLLSALLFSFHLADDVVRGMSPGGASNVVGALVLVVWLYGALVLAGRRSGYAVTLVLALLASGVPVLHMTGPGLVGGGAGSGGVFFWVWTLLALQVTAMFSVILSARGLWSLRGGRPGPAPAPHS